MKIRLSGIWLSGMTLGAFATTVQISLLRGALAVSYGSELILGAALASWLMAIALGAVLAARTRITPILIISTAVVAALLSMGCLPLQTFLPDWLGLSPGALLSTSKQFLVIAATIAPPSALCGFLFTAAVSLANSDEDVRVAGQLCAAEAVGALTAGLSIAFALQTRVDPISLIGGSGALLITALTLSLYKSFRIRGRIVAAIAIAMLLVSIFSGVTARFDRWCLAHSAPGLFGEINGTIDTPYGRLILKNREGQYTLIRDGSVALVFPDPWDAPLSMHLALSMHPDPERVLLIEGSLPDRLSAVRNHGVPRVDALALDPGEDRLIAPFLPTETRQALLASGTRRLYGDSRPHLRKTRGMYDVIIAATPPPLSAAANRYHTVEFFRAAKGALAPDGIFVMEMPGSANYLCDDCAIRLAGEYRTLQEVFAGIRIFPGTTTLIAAARSDNRFQDANPETFLRRFREQALPTAAIAPEQLLDRLDPGRTAAVLSRIRSITAQINRDSEPVGYLEGIALDAQRRDDISAGSTSVGIAGVWMSIPVLLLLGGLAFRRSRVPSPPLFGMFTTGLCGMGGEVLILVSFGAGCGRVYSGLAWIIAMFMLGLAIGVPLGDRKKGGRSTRVFADLLMAGSMVITLLVLPRFGDSPLPYALLTLLLGVATGTSFSIFLREVFHSGKNGVIPATSMIISADHAGAAFGAFFTAIAWLPALGMAWTCAAFAGLKLLSAAVNQLFFHKSTE